MQVIILGRICENSGYSAQDFYGRREDRDVKFSDP